MRSPSRRGPHRGSPPAGRARRGPKPDAAPPPEPAEQWIFGIHPVREALESGRHLAVVWRAREVGDARVNEVTRLAESLGAAVVRVPRERLDQVARGRGHQGIAAQASPVALLTLDEALVETAGERDRLWLMLDGITDEGNAGSLVRSAAALGASAILIPAAGGVRPHAGLARCSSGAIDRVSWIRLSHPAEQLSQLRQQRFRLLGGVVTGGRGPVDGDRRGDRVLILGSEERGIRPPIDAILDVRLSIQTRPAMPSLNVAAAGAILLSWLAGPAPGTSRPRRADSPGEPVT